MNSNVILFSRKQQYDECGCHEAEKEEKTDIQEIRLCLYFQDNPYMFEYKHCKKVVSNETFHFTSAMKVHTTVSKLQQLNTRAQLMTSVKIKYGCRQIHFIDTRR